MQQVYQLRIAFAVVPNEV